MAKILTVDDSEVFRHMLKLTLVGLGHTTISAVDGKEGLHLSLENQDASLVITDINMPVMNGIELIKEIRKVNSSIPILVLSTESCEELIKSGAEAGANGWVKKPFKAVQFLDVVNRILA